MWSNASHVVYIVLSPIGSTFFIILNILTIYIFWSRMRLTSLSLLVMMNICICDIFVCLFSNSFYVLNLVHPNYAWSTGPIPCKLFKFCTMLMNIAQIYLLCTLVADRYRRLVYNTSIQWKKQHGIIFVVGCWIAATVLASPRLALFDEFVIKDRPNSNETKVSNVVCKPVGMKTEGYVTMTITTFVLAYAIPALFIMYTLVKSQLFLWKRKKQINTQSHTSASAKMNRELSLTFNLTGSLFLIIWTPFFMMSVLDLTDDLLRNKSLTHVNFTLRCTLLVIGSAKPLIYIVCLERFRRQMRLGNISAVSTTRSNSTNSSYHTNSKDIKVIHVRSLQTNETTGNIRLQQLLQPAIVSSKA